MDDFIALRSLLPSEIAIVLVGLSERQIKSIPDGILGLRRTHSAVELAELYSTADWFFNPTHEENYPTVNLEAISCGTPVVTYRTGGSPEAVIDGTGLVVERGDVDALLAGIRHFEQVSVEETREMCRNFALANFRKQDRYGEYLKLYEDIAVR